MKTTSPLGDVLHATVYSNFTLVGDTWWCTVECSSCGRVDEGVKWEQAKTPRHAALIAEERHAPCVIVNDAHEMYLAGLEEIRAAEGLLQQQHINLDRARSALAAAELTAVKRDTDAARRQVARHEEGLIQAQRRVRDVRADNER